MGRPQALNGNLDALRPAIEAGILSRRQAAKRLGVTVSTVSRALLRQRLGRAAAMGSMIPRVDYFTNVQVGLINGKAINPMTAVTATRI